MTRDEFYHLISNPEDYGYKALVEFDRLTAINAQLLEACKWANTQPHHPDCPCRNYRSPCECFKSGLEAAIRAAEEAK